MSTNFTTWRSLSIYSRYKVLAHFTVPLMTSCLLLLQIVRIALPELRECFKKSRLLTINSCNPITNFHHRAPILQREEVCRSVSNTGTTTVLMMTSCLLVLHIVRTALPGLRECFKKWRLVTIHFWNLMTNFHHRTPILLRDTNFITVFKFVQDDSCTFQYIYGLNVQMQIIFLCKSL